MRLALVKRKVGQDTDRLDRLHDPPHSARLSLDLAQEAPRASIAHDTKQAPNIHGCVTVQALQTPNPFRYTGRSFSGLQYGPLAGSACSTGSWVSQVCRQPHPAGNTELPRGSVKCSFHYCGRVGIILVAAKMDQGVVCYARRESSLLGFFFGGCSHWSWIPLVPPEPGQLSAYLGPSTHDMLLYVNSNHRNHRAN